MRERNIEISNFDYIVIQDIYSLFALDKLIKLITATKGDTNIHWIGAGEQQQDMVIGSSAFQNILLGDDTLQLSSPCQKWESNSILKENDENVLFSNVYQGQDFIALKQTYAIEPIIQLQQQQQKTTAIVISSFLHDKCMEPSATRSALNKKNYADRHGYAFIARSTEFAVTVQPTVWGKIDVIQKVLPNYEWAT
jgi:hypothetical protein